MPKQQNNMPPFADILATRLSRRQALKGFGLGGTALMLAGCGVPKQSESAASPILSGNGSLTFTEVAQGLDTQLTVPPGYQAQVLVRWGDPLFSRAPTFDPFQQSAERQIQQFGYNNDFVGFVSLPLGSDNSEHGLLVVNHEYTRPTMMYPGSPDRDELDQQQALNDMMAHGLSVVEIKKHSDGQWQRVLDSQYNRRITPQTEMQMTGPVAGSPRLITPESPDGVRTLGTYGNCAGGVTPWGTILTGEENVDFFFGGEFSHTGEQENYRRFGMTRKHRGSWSRHFKRWDMSQTPAEPLHVGWIVEIDPFDPASVPKKRTVLGRYKHEGANVFINADGHAVAYSGDDEQFEYLYKFVSKQPYQADNREANMHLLDEGTLYCARFSDEGTMQWLPLVFGLGPLTQKNGFSSQGDVLLDCRRAADLMGATPMDRPEDVEVNPVNGKVYVMLTNNSRRTDEQRDGPNPRARNRGGHILELSPPDGDHRAEHFTWEMFLIAGPKDEEGTAYHPQTSDNGWLANPDNCTFDKLGNLWIATDGAEQYQVADGVWACEVEGERRALTRRFLRTPVGAELCGPFFTPDSENFFCSVQHPGGESSFEQPSTRWPDFDDKMPPRPSVVVITKNGGGRVGS